MTPRWMQPSLMPFREAVSRSRTTEDGSRLRCSNTGCSGRLGASELSDGTLRYLLLIAALLTPRPPELMVLNEPETSLHPDVLPALARLMLQAAQRSQIIVVTHSLPLIAALRELPECHSIVLRKDFGETQIAGTRALGTPAWHWPGR